MFLENILSLRGIVGLSVIACIVVESIISFVLLNPFFFNKQNYLFLDQINNSKRSLLIVSAVIETPFVLAEIITQSLSLRLWIVLVGLTILIILTLSAVLISWRTYRTLKEKLNGENTDTSLS